MSLRLISLNRPPGGYHLGAAHTDRDRLNCRPDHGSEGKMGVDPYFGAK
jgi:hypothetical protein